MSRAGSKVQLTLIEDHKKRNKVYQKIKEGLKKKASELATLCGIPVLLICTGPDGEIDAWPNDNQHVQDIIARYQRISTGINAGKNKLDVPKLFRSRICKLQSELKKANAANLQLLDSELKSVRESIQLLENENLNNDCKEIVAIESSMEVENSTFWQDYLMQDDSLFNNSEYNYGAMMDLGLDPTDYSNFAVEDFGFNALMHHEDDGLRFNSLTRSVF